ncbi:fimbrial protein [Enterobacter asburiae]|uniref:fimbrial protein n=1 Tax=Enterobacter asburiae TaxID=61645 RepID=UPI000A2689A2|nr:fimbrial protein [Enterobacter asburiae]
MARKTDIAYLSGVSLLSLILLGATGTVRADEPRNLEFKGTLVTPPACSISNDGTVVTDFGDKVGVRKVASGAYREDVDVTLHCEENGNAWQLLLTVTGNAAGFDADSATVVTPEQTDLGVKLLLGGSPFRLGEPVKVNAGGLPKLEALLVQRPGAELEEGGFTAQATLRAEYQ